MKRSAIGVVGAGLGMVLAAGMARGQCGDPTTTLVADDHAAADSMGTALAMSNTASGMTIMSGVPLDNTAAGVDAGSVYTFLKLGGSWGQVGHFFAPDGAAGDQFGAAVAYGDPWAVVGAPGAGSGGAVYFFTRAGSTWSQANKVLGASSDGNLGASAAIEADWAVVGAPNADITVSGSTDLDAGASYVYRRQANGTWSQVMKLYQQISTSRNPGDHYGAAVGVSSGRVMSGIPDAAVWSIDLGQMVHSGGAQVVRYDSGTNQWYYDGFFIPSDPQEGDKFGASVVIKGALAVVGAPGRDTPGHVDAGEVYVYRWDGTQWVSDGILHGYSQVTGAQFGARVDLSGNRIIVSSPGEKRVFVFRKVANGQWVQDLRILDTDGPDAFGTDVAINGDDLAIGDSMDDASGTTDAGAVYAYTLTANGSDMCEGAVAVTTGTYAGCTQNMTVDGSSGCGGATAPDAWFKYTAAASGHIFIDTFGSSIDTVLSVHTGCPGTAANALICNDDFSIFETASSIGLYVVQGQTYLIRVGANGLGRGAFVLHIGAVTAQCYANCDGSSSSPILNVNDFTCFLNKYATNDPYANCDGSTVAPVLNVNDFTCFMNRYAQGCP